MKRVPSLSTSFLRPFSHPSASKLILGNLREAFIFSRSTKKGAFIFRQLNISLSILHNGPYSESFTTFCRLMASLNACLFLHVSRQFKQNLIFPSGSKHQ